MTRLDLAVEAATTFLFVPGDQPERFVKARAAGADLVIIDLEDAVAPERKELARQAVASAMDDLQGCAVRINTTAGEPDPRDLALVVGRLVAVMVPKAEPGPALATLAAALAPDAAIIALVETSRGVLGAADVARMPGVRRLALGTFDLAAEVGVDPSDRIALSWARQHLVLASAAAGLPGPIDGVTGTVHDPGVIREDAAHARRLGMAAKLCIHPAQLEPARTALLPDAKLIAWARRIMEATKGTHPGATTVDGVMVDRPVLLRAERILRAVQPPTSEATP